MSYDYVLVFEDIEGNPIPEGYVVKLDPSWDHDVIDYIIEIGTPCDQFGNVY